MPVFGRRRRPRTTRCQRCKAKIKVKNKGPVPKYCSAACKQEGYLRRRFRSLPLKLVERDLASIELRDVIWTTIMDILVLQGLVKSSLPPPIRLEPKPKKPNLRLVKNHDDPEGNNGLD
jgi:hypothetical protein